MKYYTSDGLYTKDNKGKEEQNMDHIIKKQGVAITFLTLALTLALVIGAFLYTDFVYGDDGDGTTTNTEAVNNDNGDGGENTPAPAQSNDTDNNQAVQVQPSGDSGNDVQPVENTDPVDQDVDQGTPQLRGPAPSNDNEKPVPEDPQVVYSDDIGDGNKVDHFEGNWTSEQWYSEDGVYVGMAEFWRPNAPNDPECYFEFSHWLRVGTNEIFYPFEAMTIDSKMLGEAGRVTFIAQWNSYPIEPPEPINDLAVFVNYMVTFDGAWTTSDDWSFGPGMTHSLFDASLTTESMSPMVPSVYPATEGYFWTGYFVDEAGNHYAAYSDVAADDLIAMLEGLGYTGPDVVTWLDAEYVYKTVPETVTIELVDNFSNGSFTSKFGGSFDVYDWYVQDLYDFPFQLPEPDPVEGYTFRRWITPDWENEYFANELVNIRPSDIDENGNITFIALWARDEDGQMFTEIPTEPEEPDTPDDPEVIDPTDEDADDDAEFETIYTETIEVNTEANVVSKAEANEEVTSVDSPETGDGHPILGWIIVFCLGLAGILGGILRKKN